jgi:hypothetical protein
MAGDKKQSALAAFVERLVPARHVRIEDLESNAYEVPTRVSARRNIGVTRALQAVLGSHAARNAFERLGSLVDRNDFDMGAMAIHVAALISDEETVDLLARAFGEAHPGTIAEARAKNQLPDATAADLFPIEEIVTALAPLFVGLARRSVQALNAASGAEPAAVGEA